MFAVVHQRAFLRAAAAVRECRSLPSLVFSRAALFWGLFLSRDFHKPFPLWSVLLRLFTLCGDWEEVSVVDPDAFQFLLCSEEVENVGIWTVVKRLGLCWSSSEDSKTEGSSRQFCTLCLLQDHGAGGRRAGQESQHAVLAVPHSAWPWPRSLNELEGWALAGMLFMTLLSPLIY